MTKKPCIICDIECDKIPLPPGDSFSLTLLHICSDACLWETALNYLDELSEQMGYRNYLSGLMLPEERQQLREYHEKMMEFIRSQREGPKYNADLLSTPMPDFDYSSLIGASLPLQSGATFSLTSPTRAQKISALQECVERTINILKGYERDVNNINEMDDE